MSLANLVDGETSSEGSLDVSEKHGNIFSSFKMDSSKNNLNSSLSNPSPGDNK